MHVHDAQEWGACHDISSRSGLIPGQFPKYIPFTNLLHTLLAYTISSASSTVLLHNWELSICPSFFLFPFPFTLLFPLPFLFFFLLCWCVPTRIREYGREREIMNNIFLCSIQLETSLFSVERSFFILLVNTDKTSFKMFHVATNTQKLSFF